MKNFILKSVLISLTVLISSCSSSSTEEFMIEEELQLKQEEQVAFNIESSPMELDILKLINEYRLKNGFAKLEQLNIIKTKTEEHTDYMIDKNEISHDNFSVRANYLITNTKSVSVGENVASGFDEPSKLVNAWINSPAHKENIEGDYNYFDITAKQNIQGNWYFTNIFVKK